jgi:hypothetical protein
MRQSHSGIDSRQAIKAAFFPLLRPKYSLFRAKIPLFREKQAGWPQPSGIVNLL